METALYRILPVLLLAVAGIGAAGCTMPMPETESAEYKLYESKCSLCHPVYSPKLLDRRTWGFVVKRMEKKVKATGIRELLTEEEKATILSYLRKHARERGM
jgi:cytochrome c5